MQDNDRTMGSEPRSEGQCSRSEPAEADDNVRTDFSDNVSGKPHSPNQAAEKANKLYGAERESDTWHADEFDVPVFPGQAGIHLFAADEQSARVAAGKKFLRQRDSR
jgi:hypothetical protein